MNKRAFHKALLMGGAGLLGASFLSGCISRISKVAADKESGTPYRCERCGYITRSHTDISHDRCPRCRAKKLVEISEEEMAKSLAAK